ncbi:hypothetical protein N9265_00810 [bacterium]|nr:hypothetical protein [bacterium]
MTILKQASLLMYPSGYKSGKIYSILPKDGSGDLTFTRASTATRVNESGLIETVAIDTPRIDYTGGGCGSLLLESQRTNTVLSNSDYTASWSLTNVIPTANVTISPNGSNDAQKLTSANTFGQHYIRQILGGHTVGAPHVYSCFAKAAELDILTLRLLNGGSPNVNFDLTNGTHDGGANGKMIDFGNGWWRCITYHPSAASQYLYPYIYTQVGNQQGDGVSGFYVYGAMLEEGTVETSLIDTTTTTVTRTRDTSITTGLSSVINSVEGAIFVEMAALANDSTNRYISINNGTSAKRIILKFGTSSNNISALGLGTANSFNMSYSGATITNMNKIALKYKANDCALWVNGVEVATDTTFTAYAASTLSHIAFSNFSGGGQWLEANVQSVAVYNTALSDADLTTLTTL